MQPLEKGWWNGTTRRQNLQQKGGREGLSCV